MRKVRVIALYIQFRDGVPDEDRRRLYQHARLTLAEQDAVNALVHLGVRIARVRIYANEDNTVTKFSTRAPPIKIPGRGSNKRIPVMNMSSQGLNLR